ncbi:MAG TPA: PilZ domain-containing protein [Candidatus Acidoferrales bacterium]|nr:PilZ domain-containing protein [Candidatus Acidoferrales bacterium]
MPDGSEGRERPRVRTELAIRVRQTGPPRETMEVASTLDVSRNGVLFRTRQPYEMHSTVWVIVPYNPKSMGEEVEFPATVVRVESAPDGSSEVAVRFLNARSDPTPVNVQGRSVMQEPAERRTKDRSNLMLPIRVRGENESEVTQTVDISRTGVLFRATRSYTVGQSVRVTVPFKPEEPAEEIEARVVRIIERSSTQCVAVQYTRTTGIRPPTE